MAHDWIKGAIKHHGALHKQLGIPTSQKIPHSALQKASEANGLLGQRARLAMTLSHFAKK